MLVGLRSRRERRFHAEWQEWPLRRLVDWWEGRLRAANKVRRRAAKHRKRARADDGGRLGGDIRLLLGGWGDPGNRKRANGRGG